MNENAANEVGEADHDHAWCAYCGRSGGVIHKVYHVIGRRSKKLARFEFAHPQRWCCRDYVIHDRHHEYVASVSHNGYVIELCGFAVNTCEGCLEKYKSEYSFSAMLIAILIALCLGCGYLSLVKLAKDDAYESLVGAFALIGVCCAVGICFLIHYMGRNIRRWRTVAASHSLIRSLLAEGFSFRRCFDECYPRDSTPCSEVEDGFKVEDIKHDYSSLFEQTLPRLMREDLDTKDWSHECLIKYPRSYGRESFDRIDHVEYEWLGVLR